MAPSARNVIREIKEEKIGATVKRALIVEGTDDAFVIGSFLGKHFPRWERNWVIGHAGKKSRVIEILEKEPDWIGIVDRDEWLQEVVSEIQERLPNLWVLPRFCIENYIIIPEELWSTLPAKQQFKIQGGYSTLENLLLQNLDQWVAHGVLWSVINPLWEGLRARGFKEELLKPSIATDEARIRATLEAWHTYLDPDRLIQQHKARLEEVMNLPTSEKLGRWVHGKLFFTNIVIPALNSLLGQRDTQTWRKELFPARPVPNDFNTLWPMIGLTS